MFTCAQSIPDKDTRGSRSRVGVVGTDSLAVVLGGAISPHGVWDSMATGGGLGAKITSAVFNGSTFTERSTCDDKL